MKRRLLNLLTLLSLLVCLCALALCVRTFDASDVLTWNGFAESAEETRLAGWHARQTCGVMELRFVRFSVAQREGEERRTLRKTYELGRATPFWQARESQPFSPDPDRSLGPAPFRSPSPLERAGLYAFARGFRNVGTPVDFHLVSVGVPHWVVLLVTAPAPLVAGYRRLRTFHRRRSGRCPQCGYDLRATPRRCPECGTAATVRSARRSPHASALPPSPLAGEGGGALHKITRKAGD